MRRRDFLKTATAGVSAAAASTTILRAQTQTSQPEVPAADRIQIATIGFGIQGINDTRAALRVPDVELVAVADVYDGRLTLAKEMHGDQVFTTRDYREVLSRPDVDAVIIATPDHWHARVAIDAMKAGKDVYVEKPMVQDPEDGLELIETERRTKRIVEVGSQRVSSIVYAKARDIFRAGSIGELNLVEAYINRNSSQGAWQYSIPPDASPQTIDWDRFLGDAPKRPFEPIRMFRWRNYRDYGTGIPGDLFVHLFSGIHFVLDSLGPTRIIATGGIRYWKDGRDVPDVMLALFDYPKTSTHPAHTLMLKVNFADGSGEGQAFRFVGPDGVITIGGGSVTLARRQRPKEPGHSADTFSKAMEEEFMKQYRTQYPERPELRTGAEEVFMAPREYSDSVEHFRTFFNAMRSRQPVIEDATFGLRAGGPAVLANHSFFEGRAINWDPEKMKRTNGGRSSE
ncbi:MAG TPA: Gfo/Idh/MocA family oxidoreductase [Vicinamibacterales bacterium]|jgi:predicted dehydrogenase|nr:Gfo/Idh/MocA family oxidoreductase [Vicinamibacterales bacterium]